MGFIYVIGSTRNPVKVGRARYPQKRLITLQIGNPDELLLHHEIVVPKRIGDGVAEFEAHAELWAHVRRGEWFDIDADEAAERIRTRIKRLDWLADRTAFAGRIPLSHEEHGALVAYREDVRRGRQNADIAAIHAQRGGNAKRLGNALASSANSIVKVGDAWFIDAPAYQKTDIQTVVGRITEYYRAMSSLLAA